MKDVLIWIATLSVGIAILIAMIPLVPFLIGIATAVFTWWVLARLLVWAWEMCDRWR